MSNEKIMLAVLIMAVVTAALRFAPFLLFANGTTPKTVVYLGKVLPYAVMGMLVVYCLKDISFSYINGFLPELIASALVAVSYIIGKNTLVSIVGGTLCYMALIQFVFV